MTPRMVPVIGTIADSGRDSVARWGESILVEQLSQNLGIGTTDFPRRVVRIPLAKGRINADDHLEWPKSSRLPSGTGRGD